jgi:hypothetical protein
MHLPINAVSGSEMLRDLRTHQVMQTPAQTIVCRTLIALNVPLIYSCCERL